MISLVDLLPANERLFQEIIKNFGIQTDKVHVSRIVSTYDHLQLQTFRSI